MNAFAELVSATNFSFLRGASSPSNMALTALLLGYSGLGVTDRNSVAGVVRAYSALKELREKKQVKPQKRRVGGSPGEYEYIEAPQVDLLSQIDNTQLESFKLAVGARLAFADDTPDIVVYPQNRNGWGRLCRLLTTGNLRGKKGDCRLFAEDLLNAQDLLFIVMPPRQLAPLPVLVKKLQRITSGDIWIGATMLRRGDDRRRLARLTKIAHETRTPLIATNDALYASHQERDLQDIITCIREGVTLAKAGRRLEINAERHLKAPAEMARLFTDAPEAIRETQHFLARVNFSLDELHYDYPEEPIPPGRDAQEWLEEITFRYAPMRYPQGVPAKVEKLLQDELALIRKLDYARYFLTIHDIVRVANDKGILCQGRGSAANSAVCYVLGITCVDPAEHDVLFARFVSEERREPPDIDVDFEHERREEIIQHIYAKYGRARAGLVATVISYRPRSAIREVGKVFDLSEDVTAALANTQWGSFGSDIPDAYVAQAGLDPKNPVIHRTIHFAKRLLGFPRHLSQHVGGFVLTRGRLDELCPIGNAAMPDRTFIEWDKDDIDALGLLKVDVLALGMLTCIRKALDYLRDFEGLDWGLAEVPTEDPETYEMLCRGDSIGVFQVESRAQINMLPRLKPRTFYDLVIEVAIVRPGPIQGNMVHPYLRRRSGAEPVSFPSPAPPHDPDELRKVLHKTMGVPLFQEQAMKIAMVAAEFSDIEANQLRRAMATFRHVGTIHLFEKMMVERMAARGYDRDFAQNCFEQIKGFGSYGFPESHAASFAKLVYISSWLKRHHPAIFACALLNSQPMGFYAPAQIVRDAREHGVEVRAVDVNFSHWDNTLERRDDGALALRLGFRQADGVHEEEAKRVVAARGDGYASVEDLATRAELYGRPMRALADADAFRSLGGPPPLPSPAAREREQVARLIQHAGSTARNLNDEKSDNRNEARNLPPLPRKPVGRRASQEPPYGGGGLGREPTPTQSPLDRRKALWAVRRLPEAPPLPLFAAADARELAEEQDARLPEMSLGEHVAADYQTLRLSLKAHPMAILRPAFARERVLTCAELNVAHDGVFARVAGLVLVRQRPGGGKAIFVTLEDETGVANLVIWARMFERFRREVMAARLMLAQGRVQKSPENVVHLMTTSVYDRSAELNRLSENLQATPQTGDYRRHPRNVRVIPKSRDFH